MRRRERRGSTFPGDERRVPSAANLRTRRRLRGNRSRSCCRRRWRSPCWSTSCSKRDGPCGCCTRACDRGSRADRAPWASLPTRPRGSRSSSGKRERKSLRKTSPRPCSVTSSRRGPRWCCSPLPRDPSGSAWRSTATSGRCIRRNNLGTAIPWTGETTWFAPSPCTSRDTCGWQAPTPWTALSLGKNLDRTEVNRRASDSHCSGCWRWRFLLCANHCR